MKNVRNIYIRFEVLKALQCDLLSLEGTVQ
jgi:hypothetical protein